MQVDAKGLLLLSAAGREVIFWSTSTLKSLYHYKFDFGIIALTQKSITFCSLSPFSICSYLENAPSDRLAPSKTKNCSVWTSMRRYSAALSSWILCSLQVLCSWWSGTRRSEGLETRSLWTLHQIQGPRGQDQIYENCQKWRNRLPGHCWSKWRDQHLGYSLIFERSWSRITGILAWRTQTTLFSEDKAENHLSLSDFYWITLRKYWKRRVKGGIEVREGVILKWKSKEAQVEEDPKEEVTILIYITLSVSPKTSFSGRGLSRSPPLCVLDPWEAPLSKEWCVLFAAIRCCCCEKNRTIWMCWRGGCHPCEGIPNWNYRSSPVCLKAVFLALFATLRDILAAVWLFPAFFPWGHYYSHGFFPFA